ncbi:hypothetical protein ACNKHW_00955 [Shigella flexneri]
MLKSTNTRIHNDMRVNPAFLFAAMFWYPLLETAQKESPGKRPDLYHDAFALAMNDVLDKPAVHWQSQTPDDVNPRYLAVAVAYVPTSR